MSLDELRSNNWHHISQHVAAKRIKSPNLLSLAEVETETSVNVSDVLYQVTVGAPCINLKSRMPPCRGKGVASCDTLRRRLAVNQPAATDG
jgi:hypothetical protein